MRVGSLVRTRMIDYNGRPVLGVVEKIYGDHIILRFSCVDELCKHYKINSEFMRIFNPKSLVVIKE